MFPVHNVKTNIGIQDVHCQQYFYIGYSQCTNCQKMFHSIGKHKCKKAQSVSLLPQAIIFGRLFLKLFTEISSQFYSFLGVKHIEENRVGSPDLSVLVSSIQENALSVIPKDFERGWAERPKRTERGQGSVSKDMMVALEKCLKWERWADQKCPLLRLLRDWK